MNRLERENLMISIQSDIQKIEHVSGNIVQRYGLDLDESNEDAGLMFAPSRENIKIEMDILMDYIREIRDNFDTLQKEVYAF